MNSGTQMGDFRTRQTLETFSFLPPLTQEEVYAQIEFMLEQGLTPAIEHEAPERSTDHYWTMWKLPFFGERELSNVVAELEECHRTYPNHHVRLIGYDSYTQSQGVCFVVYRAKAW